MNEDCPKGIKNEKDIERLGERFSIMFEQLEKGLDKLDKKMDALDQKFDLKIDELKKSIPIQINEAVDAKWKSGVYSVVKWLVITLLVAVIGAVIRMYIV